MKKVQGHISYLRNNFFSKTMFLGVVVALVVGCFFISVPHSLAIAYVANVTTNDATSITTTDATLNATVGADASGHSFWVSLSPIDTSSSNIPSGVYSTPDFGSITAGTSFSATLSSLTTTGIPTDLPAITPNTTYYFVAWSDVGGVWSPGSVLTFTTDAVLSSVNTISDINVTNGTALASVSLPTTVGVTLSDSTTPTVAVTWDGGSPAYDGNTAGTYTFTGTLTMPTGVDNLSNLTASVNVGVAAAVVTPPCSSGIGSPLLVDVTQQISNDPDSGNFGGDWALDNFSRHIQVWAEGGHYCAQADDSGTFTTFGGVNGKSPQSGSSLPEVVTGSMTGGTHGEITGATLGDVGSWGDTGTAPAQDCHSIDCSMTSLWVNNYFSGGTYSYDNGWSWTYNGGPNGTWTNASSGSTGDIIHIVPSDLTALTAEIATANAALVGVTEGTVPGNHVVGSSATLTTAITVAQAVTATQPQSDVDAATATLTSAVAAFNGAIVGPSDVTALNASMATAQGLITANASESTTPGNHVIGSLATLSAALTATTATSADAQSVVDGQTATLNDAITAYNLAIVPAPLGSGGLTSGAGNTGGSNGGSSNSSSGGSSSSSGSSSSGGTSTTGTSSSTGSSGTGQVLGASTGPTSTVIPGCDNRTTGFSTTNGQSCVGNTTTTTAGQVLGAQSYHFTLTLKMGSKGNEVTELQKFLNTAGDGILKVDGKFGTLTKAALIKFQLANGLTGDGVVGASTRALLNK